MKSNSDLGSQMYQWAKDLFPVCRSITGNGVRYTLAYIKNILPDLRIYEVPSGYQAFDWNVPDEWNIRDAFILDENGNKIVNFQHNTLHVLGYSEPINRWITYQELDEHLYSLPEQPDAIPYITSYYRRRWGFCITENQRNQLRRYPLAKYFVNIDSTLAPGYLSYGELIIKGKTKQEILFSTYICHPSMANNELSGPIVTTALAQWLANQNKPFFTYRILFIPETIGSIVYLSKHWEYLKKYTKAGFVITCVGDEKTYSYVASRFGNTLADKVALHVLKNRTNHYQHYSFLERGSDERQYCSPGIDLPVCSVCRSKYNEYPEYHTSLDDLNFISPQGLEESYNLFKEIVYILENNKKYKSKVLCEPQLGKRGLYPTLSTKQSGILVRNMMNLIAYADSNHDLIDIGEIIGVYAGELIDIAKNLLKSGVLEIGEDL